MKATLIPTVENSQAIFKSMPVRGEKINALRPLLPLPKIMQPMPSLPSKALLEARSLLIMRKQKAKNLATRRRSNQAAALRRARTWNKEKELEKDTIVGQTVKKPISVKPKTDIKKTIGMGVLAVGLILVMNK